MKNISLRSIVRILTAGMLVGAVLVAFLVFDLTLRGPDRSDVETGKFMGIPVLEITRTTPESGEVVHMRLLQGMLIPLLGPSVFLFALYLLACAMGWYPKIQEHG